MSKDHLSMSNDLFPAKVTILSADGRILFTKELSSFDDLYQSLQPYSEGLYFYQINAKNMQIGK